MKIEADYQYAADAIRADNWRVLKEASPALQHPVDEETLTAFKKAIQPYIKSEVKEVIEELCKDRDFLFELKKSLLFLNS